MKYLRKLNENILDNEFDIFIKNQLILNYKIWSDISDFKNALVNYKDSKLLNEFEYRITDGEDPKKVISDIFNKLDYPSDEMIKINSSLIH